jgi:ABC-2 type transport system permease protein
MRISNIISKRNRILLRELVVTDFKLRYQGSLLGYAWSLLKPLMLFTIMYFVFVKFLGLSDGVPHPAVYLLIGIIMWTFFTEATVNGLRSILDRGDLIRKINFPKYIIVISGTVSALINLGLNMIVILVFIIFNHVGLGWNTLMLIPLIFELYVFALGIAFFLAAVNIKFRDVGYLWEIFLQAAFYATPILYLITRVIHFSPLVAKVLMLSPVTQILQDVRYFVVTNQTITTWSLVHGWKVLIPFMIIIVTVIIASLYFKHNQARFAEQI